MPEGEDSKSKKSQHHESIQIGDSVKLTLIPGSEGVREVIKGTSERKKLKKELGD